MGFFDEFSESPEQEKEERAQKEGLREASEGGIFSNILDDVVDEFNEGRDFLDQKVATREGERERLRGDSYLDNVANDTYDEFARGPEFVARKQHYRDGPGDSSSAEESPNHESGDECCSDYSSGDDNYSSGYPGGGGSNSPSSGPSSTDSSPDDLDDVAVVGGAIILGLLIWMSSCVVKFIRTPHPDTPTSAISSSGQERPLQLGIVAACSAVRAWRDYTPKSEFMPGEELLLYAEAVDVNRNGRIDLLFDDKIVAANGNVIANATVPVAKSAATDPSWANWQAFRIPTDTPPGSYIATVSMRDNITGLVGTQSISFSVGAVGAQTSSELQMGMVATCLAVRGWRDYTAQTSFMPGDQVFLYSEALNVNHEGRMDLSFDDSIFTPTGTKLLGTAVPVSTTATVPSWAAWPNFTIPSDAPPGPYTATVAVRDNLTGDTGSKSVMFTVSAPNQTPTAEVDGTVADPDGTTTDREDAKPIAQMPSSSPAGQTQSCYDGVWQENEANQFVWNFRRYGNTLRISRNDRFVKGEFQRSPDGWVGFLSWGNGTIWRGVVLHEANDSCDEITTNQRWWYKR